MFTGDELQSNEANYIHLNPGIKLKSLCIQPVNTLLHGSQTKSLWDYNFGKQSRELNEEITSNGKSSLFSEL